MAVAVVGGLVTSTFLSLLIIPVVFTFVDDVIGLSRRIFHRRESRRPPPRLQDTRP